jgi:hypothetical protein
MQVGMMEQVLPPGVEDGEESDARPEMFGISGNPQQRFGGGAE